MDIASVLLVHDYEYPLRDLRSPLKRLGFDSRRARSCAEARSALSSSKPPALMFTDTELPDGGWADVVALGAGACSPVPVVVVSRVVDICLYLDTIERGATEFIVPPFLDAEISYVVRGERLNVSRRASRLPGGSIPNAAMASRQPVLGAGLQTKVRAALKSLL